MHDSSLQHIEERIAWLQRHVTEQDKAMLKQSDELSRLRREVKALRERISMHGEGAPPLPADERPPHY